MNDREERRFEEESGRKGRGVGEVRTEGDGGVRRGRGRCKERSEQE